MSSIFLKNVSKSFLRRGETRLFGRKEEQRPVLKDISLEVEQGESVCVLGKNGSGKTTLTRILSTLLIPDRGEARVCGFDVVKQPESVRKRIGVVLNAGDGGFHARISAQSNLEYYGALSKVRQSVARERIPFLLSDLGIDDRGADQVQSYSSGMRRRLALARALLPNPEVLLLDEPTLGVDPRSMKLIHKRLVDLTRTGKTIFCTTNNIGEAEALGDRVFEIENGELCQLTNREAIILDPAF